MKLEHNPAALTSPGTALSERSRWENTLTRAVDTHMIRFLDDVLDVVYEKREVNPMLVDDLYQDAVTSLLDTLDADEPTVHTIELALRQSPLPDEVYDTANYLLTELKPLDLSDDDFHTLLVEGLDYDVPSITDEPSLQASAVPRMVGQVLARSVGRGKRWRVFGRETARTAATSALNEAQNRYMQRNDFTHKQWITRRDLRVRETHADADGQIVPKASLFRVGAATLSYPGQGTFPPEEIYNCRCVMIAVNADGSTR